MQHINGNKWTYKTIENGIMQVISALCLNRMPTNKEVNDSKVEIGLSNAISRTLGYYGWAAKLNLPIKQSDTFTGIEAELNAKAILENKGYTVETTPTRFPYDLLVNKSVKIDVKMSNAYTNSQGSSFYSFSLHNKQPTCDLYMLIANDEENNKSIFIVPANAALQSQISIGKFDSKYYKYKNCFYYIDEFIKFYKSIS